VIRELRNPEENYKSDGFKSIVRALSWMPRAPNLDELAKRKRSTCLSLAANILRVGVKDFDL